MRGLQGSIGAGLPPFSFHCSSSQSITRPRPAGTLADPSQVTVGDYLTNFLANATHISPKTLERYHELAARQIIPHLGEIKLQKLRPEDLERWHKALAATLSARTIGHAHRLVAAMLVRAVENGTVARNVAAIRKPPRVEQREVGFAARQNSGRPRRSQRLVGASCRHSRARLWHAARRTPRVALV
jgi:hypothetical protein